MSRLISDKFRLLTAVSSLSTWQTCRRFKEEIITTESFIGGMGVDRRRLTSPENELMTSIFFSRSVYGHGGSSEHNKMQGCRFKFPEEKNSSLLRNDQDRTNEMCQRRAVQVVSNSLLWGS